jgi:hypothetical protein
MKSRLAQGAENINFWLRDTTTVQTILRYNTASNSNIETQVGNNPSTAKYRWLQQATTTAHRDQTQLGRPTTAAAAVDLAPEEDSAPDSGSKVSPTAEKITTVAAAAADSTAGTAAADSIAGTVTAATTATSETAHRQQITASVTPTMQIVATVTTETADTPTTLAADITK